MRVIVDANVWSEALRKREGDKSPEVLELIELIRESRVQMIGLIRMEILSGIRDKNRFRLLEKRISAFPDLPLDSEVFVASARFFNTCRESGIQGSNTDFVICACSWRWKMPILTKDKDYPYYRRHLPISLHVPRAQG